MAGLSGSRTFTRAYDTADRLATLTVSANDSGSLPPTSSVEERNTAEHLVYAGNQQQLMANHSKLLSDKIDQMDVEARNQHWIRSQTVEQSYQNQTVLWVIGATHLGGLIGELKQAGWGAAAQAL